MVLSASEAICTDTGTIASILPISFTTAALAKQVVTRYSSLSSSHLPVPSTVTVWSEAMIEQLDIDGSVTVFLKQRDVKVISISSLFRLRPPCMADVPVHCGRVLFEGADLVSSRARFSNKRFRSSSGQSGEYPNKVSISPLFMQSKHV